MIEPNPFKDAETNPEPPKRDFRDFLDLVVSFFWFFRRVIVGLVLLGALGFWIHRVTTMPKSPDVGSNVSLGPQRSLEPKVPTANIDFGSAEHQPAATGDIGENSSAGAVLGPKMDQAEVGPKTDPSQNSPPENLNSFESMLETATVDELIEESLNLSDSWGPASSSVGLLMLTRRAKISRRLMEMELSDTQRTFAMTSYIKSISLIDSLNTASKMKMEGPRDALLEVDETYSNHPDPTVNAKSNMAMVLAPIYECIASKNPEWIQTIQQEFDNRFDKIVADPSSVSRLAELSLVLNKNAELKTAVQPFLTNFLQRMNQSESPRIIHVAKIFKENILFEKFDLKSFPRRLDVEDPEMRKTVQEFFETLAANPDSRPPVYQAAVTMIVQFQFQGKPEEAKSLIDWLEQICATITVERTRRAVVVAVEKLRKGGSNREVDLKIK